MASNNLKFSMFCASSLLKNTRLDKEIELIDISKNISIYDFIYEIWDCPSNGKLCSISKDDKFPKKFKALEKVFKMLFEELHTNEINVHYWW